MRGVAGLRAEQHEAAGFRGGARAIAGYQRSRQPGGVAEDVTGDGPGERGLHSDRRRCLPGELGDEPGAPGHPFAVGAAEESDPRAQVVPADLPHVEGEIPARELDRGVVDIGGARERGERIGQRLDEHGERGRINHPGVEEAGFALEPAHARLGSGSILAVDSAGGSLGPQVGGGRIAERDAQPLLREPDERT